MNYATLMTYFFFPPIYCNSYPKLHYGPLLITSLKFPIAAGQPLTNAWLTMTEITRTTSKDESTLFSGSNNYVCSLLSSTLTPIFFPTLRNLGVIPSLEDVSILLSGPVPWWS